MRYALRHLPVHALRDLFPRFPVAGNSGFHHAIGNLGEATIEVAVTGANKRTLELAFPPPLGLPVGPGWVGRNTGLEWHN